MKNLIHTALIIIICGALCVPSVTARGRNNNSNSQRTELNKSPNNGNNNGRPGNQTINRPGNSNNRPGNNGHNNSFKPVNNGQGNQFGNNGRPQHPEFNNRPDNRPNNQPHFGGNHNYMPAPPHRPHMPLHNPWHRPTPPMNYRPAPGWRPISTILGITLGSAVSFTVNTLVNAGYSVSGYGNDAVYVNNVPMLNLMWPDATLYYGNGGLYASEFVYSTAAYDTNRYYRAYNSLVSYYGSPSQFSNSNGILMATWWGNNGQFIRLSYTNGIAYNGTNRFFTTLSFGN